MFVVNTTTPKNLSEFSKFWASFWVKHHELSKHHGFSVEFGSNSEVLKHLFECRVLNTKAMLFSTTYHDMDNMGRSVSWMYLHLVSFADQLVQNCKRQGPPTPFPVAYMLHSWVGLPHSTGVQPSRRQLSTAWSQTHCTSSIHTHTQSPLLHLSSVREDSINDFQGIYTYLRAEWKRSKL